MAVVGPGFHQQGEGCQLRGPVVDLQPEQVLLQDQRRDVFGSVAPLLIDRFEQVVGFHQDVPGAAGRIEQRQFFRVQAGRRDRLELLLHFRRLLGRLDVILHLLPQRRLRVGRQPLPTERVLHEVFDDPVRCEQLCGGGDVRAGDHLADHGVLLLRDVELIQPADDLDFLPILLVNLADQLANQRVRVQQVVRQQEFRLVVNPLEQKRHRRVQGVTLRGEQQPVQLGLLVPGQLEVDNRFAFQARQFDMLGMLQDFGRLSGR